MIKLSAVRIVDPDICGGFACVRQVSFQKCALGNGCISGC